MHQVSIGTRNMFRYQVAFSVYTEIFSASQRAGEPKGADILLSRGDATSSACTEKGFGRGPLTAPAP